MENCHTCHKWVLHQEPAADNALPSLCYAAPTLLSPALMRTHNFLVHENAKLLVGGAAAGHAGNLRKHSSVNFLTVLRSSPRFQELVTTMSHQKDRQSYGWQSSMPHAAPVPCHCVRRAFATLRRHVHAQQREVHMLIRSLAAWRRQRLLQHLQHWQRLVIERRFDALASSFDAWRRRADAAAHTHLLEERLAALAPALRLSPLSRYMHWWSFITDITRAVRLSQLASSLWALQTGVHISAWTRAAKRRALCFSNALTLTRSFHGWHTFAEYFRYTPSPPPTFLPAVI